MRLSLPRSISTLIITLVMLLGASEAVHAQLQAVGVAFPGGSDVDLSAYPKVRSRMRVTFNGQPLQIATSNVILIQSNTALRPATVVHEGQGIHVVEWINSQFDSFLVDVLITHQGQTASISHRKPLTRSVGATVVFRDSLSRNMPGFADFESVPVGRSDTMKLKIVATEAALQNGQERMIRIDSITVDHPNLKVNWKGSFRSSPPPVMIISPLEYRIDVICAPTNTDPIAGVVSVYYEGGMRKTLLVVANPRSYPQRTILNLLSPNGGEAFAPCQQIPVTWQGAIPGFYSYVELSTDNGQSWAVVDSTLDSLFVWEVPVVITDSARIRVSQKFQASEPRWLNGPEASATSATYSANGRYLLVAYSDGTVNEWDAATFTQLSSYTVPLAPLQEIPALSYIGQSRDVLAIASRPDIRGGTLYRFAQGASTPTQKDLPADVLVRSVATSDDGSTIYVLPQQTARIVTYTGATLAEQSAITFPVPVASSSYANARITVALLDGTVSMYDANTGALLRSANTGLLEAMGPYTYRVAASPDGRLAGLAGKRRTDIANGAKEQRTFIFDVETASIMKVIYRETSESVSLSFTPSNTYLAMGFEYNPQFVVYDITRAQVLPPTGSSAGHLNRVTYLAFSPDGSTLISTSIDSTKNALLRRVSSPESDASDNVFRIAPVELTVKTLTFRSSLIGIANDTTFVADVCNTGSVPAIVKGSYLLNGSWLRIVDDLNGDTVMPGACFRLHLESVPADTGLLRDTLALQFCGKTTFIPIEHYSIDRNLSLLIAEENFGDVCIGQKTVRTLAMLRNNDDVPLVINTVFVERGLLAQFRVLNLVPDTVIPPGGTLALDVEFAPRRLGFDTAKIIIRYANQRAVERTIRLTGRGSGADLDLSHLVLPFMPEIPERTIKLRNRSDNPLTITTADITAGEPFVVVSTLPVTIPPKDSIEIRVRYLGGTVGSQAEVQFTVEPCAASTRVRLASYAGSAVVSAPTLQVEPRGDTTSLVVTATITEQVAYAGERFFETILTVDDRLFLAKSVVSPHGSAEIVSQDIVNGLRRMHVRVTGAFSGTGEILRIKGYPGMAGIDESPLVFDTTSLGFGSAVQVRYESGLLRIIHNDPIRRIVKPRAPMIQGISPQPAQHTAQLTINAAEESSVMVRILDASGRDVVQPRTQVLAIGEQTMFLDVHDLIPGMYRVIVVAASGTSTSPLVIVR